MKFIYNCEPLFIAVFFIYRISRACVIKVAVKSSIFVSTETKYVSQIHLDVSQIYCGSCHRQAFQAFAIPLLFDGKWPHCVRCLMLPGKIVTCQSSVKWNKFRRVPSSTECNSLISVYCVTFHFIQSPFLLVKIPQQLALQSEFLMLRTNFFLLRMIVRSSSWCIGHVNFGRRAGDLCSNLVASSKFLVAMATKMVATWRVDIYISPHSQKHACIDSKAVPAARSPLTTPLARRLAPHACMWHGPLQQGGMSTQKPQTRSNNWVKYPETQSISSLFNTENSAN